MTCYADYGETCVAELRTGAPCDGLCQFTPPPPVPPPATDRGELEIPRSYPRPKQPRVRNRADSHWTIGDALRFLDPPPPRRTVSRWLRSIEPVGQRALKQGGPPARTYPARSIMERHAVWASKGAKR